MSDRYEGEPSQFDGLSASQQGRLSELLDTCLVCLERGQPVDRAAIVARHPDLAGPIQSYLDSLEFLQDAAAGFAPSAAPNDLLTNATEDIEQRAGEKRIGDFRVLEEIGRGGMGVVYDAWQISLDRRVALKVLPFASLLDGKQIARFRNEAQAAARLHHPNIVPVFAVGNERGVHYYAMQQIDGQPLDRIISAVRENACARNDKRARPSATQGNTSSPAPTVASDQLTTTYATSAQEYFRNVAQLGIQVAGAMQAAHEEGIIHRDIKPSNLLLDVEGKLWVADFGLARCRNATELTGSGDVIGTMRYMSPEQARGNSAYLDHRSDIYSLGVTLYELLTLRQAVRGDDAVDIVRRLDREEPYPPRQWDANIPLDLETIVLTAMAKSPAARYATAQDLALDLQRFLTGESIVARRPTLADRIGKWTRRHRRATVAAACAMLTVLVGLSLGTALLSRQSRRTAQALAVARSNDQQYRRQLARTTNHMAMLQEQQGDAKAAEVSFQQAVRLQRGILAELPDDEQTLRDLSATLNNLGFLHDRQDVHRAAAEYHRSIEVLRQLADLSPTNHPVRKDLALAISNLGSHHRRQGNPQQAVTLLDEACRRFGDLAEPTAVGANHGHDLAVCFNNLGMAQNDLDQLEDAEASFGAALRAIQRPDTPLAGLTATQLSVMGGIYDNLGSLQEKRGRLRDAVASYTLAVRFQLRASRQVPQATRFQALLDRHYFRGERVMRRLGDYSGAAEWIAARRALRPRDPRHLWSVAEQWALLAQAAGGDDSAGKAGDAVERDGPAKANHDVEAMSVLRQAIALGLQPRHEMLESNLANLSRDAEDLRQWFANVNPRT